MSSVHGRLPRAGWPAALDVGDRLVNQTGFQERTGEGGPAIDEQRPNPAINQRRKQVARFRRGIGSEREHAPTVPSGRTFFEPVIIAQNSIVDESEIVYVHRNVMRRAHQG